jgi:serine/threonine protein kinase
MLTFSEPNILIDDNGHACVSDFGLASIAHGKYSTGVRSDKGHTVRWSAPEVLFGTVPASKQADMFAFGMVVIEVRCDARYQVPGYHWCVIFRRCSPGKFLSIIQSPRRLHTKL